MYPVISRRSGGLSVGINLNPDKGCNFDCLYCQVDRTPEAMSKITPAHQRVNPDRVIDELSHLLGLVDSGEFFSIPPFDQTPSAHRRLTDISFSGDGEPTMVPEFPEVQQRIISYLQTRPEKTTVRIITNGTGLFKSSTRKKVLERFSQNDLPPTDRIPWSIWFKIDAADPESFAFIDRSGMSFSTYWKHVEETLIEVPATVQTMVMDYISPETVFHPEGLWADKMELAMGTLLSRGGRIQQWDLYSVARTPPVPEVRPVPQDRLERLAERFRKTVPVPVIIYP